MHSAVKPHRVTGVEPEIENSAGTRSILGNSASQRLDLAASGLAFQAPPIRTRGRRRGFSYFASRAGASNKIPQSIQCVQSVLFLAAVPLRLDYDDAVL